HSTFFFFFNDTATTEIYTLSLHDALPICGTSTASTPTCANIWASSCRSATRSEEHTSELQSHSDIVCRLLLEKNSQATSPIAINAVWMVPGDICVDVLCF